MQHEVDVAVVGAGSAGVAAAVAAAEHGASVLLIEASGAVGGTLAWQLLEHSAGFHDLHGRQVVSGFGQRLVNRLAAAGSSPGHVRDDVGYTATRTPVNHVELALAEAVMLQEAGAELWLYARLAKALVERGRVTEVVVQTPSGHRIVRPRVVVDASGDAVLARLAGAAMHRDAAGERQPASLTFKLGGVAFTTLLAYARDNPDDFHAGSRFGDAADEHVNLWGFGRLLARGHQSGHLSLRRSELHLAGWPLRGEAVVNVTRIGAGTQDIPWEGGAVMALSRQVLEFAAWFRQLVPGCANAYVAAVADRVGVRESARVVGHATLTRKDVLDGARFADAIALGAFPIDVHSSASAGLSHTEQLGEAFEIPYGCLVPKGLVNMLVAGRCISSTHEANGSVRITASCFATGEAAGTAAAICVRSGVHADELDVTALQCALKDRGAILRPAPGFVA